MICQSSDIEKADSDLIVRAADCIDNGGVEEDGLVDMLDDGIDAEILQEWFP
jgi:hypothetical protein